jgi:proteasome lid subunit RPN8/RPN11
MSSACCVERASVLTLVPTLSISRHATRLCWKFLWTGKKVTSMLICPSLAVCCAAVVVLSPEFVQTRHPMRELGIFLERKASDPSGILIIPVFLGLNEEQCDDLLSYHSHPSPQGVAQPSDQDRAESLKEWAAAVKQLRLQSTVAWGNEVGDARMLGC